MKAAGRLMAKFLGVAAAGVIAAHANALVQEGTSTRCTGTVADSDVDSSGHVSVSALDFPPPAGVEPGIAPPETWSTSVVTSSTATGASVRPVDRFSSVVDPGVAQPPGGQSASSGGSATTTGVGTGIIATLHLHPATTEAQRP